MPSIKQAAFHEAGHCVAFIALGIPFQAVVLNGTGRMTGTYESSGKEVPIKVIGVSGVSFSIQDKDAFDKDAEAGKLDVRQIIGLMAGPVAESMLAGELDEETRAAESREVRFPYFRLESDDPFREFRERTIALVKENWPGIKIIAKALVEKGRLSHLEVKKLLNGIAEEKA